MEEVIPQFKFHQQRRTRNYVSIEADGQVLHIVKPDEVDEFYLAFGYTNEIALKGILPAEFILEKYVLGDAAVKYASCLQMRIIEYLNLHSDKFGILYGDKCRKWLAAHALANKSDRELCVSCNMKPLCSKQTP